jgi:pimeloyl-ACP methyl ester carboxylesterase
MRGVLSVRIRSAAAFLVVLCATASACERTRSEPTTIPAANTTDPRWVHRNDPRADVAVVFVHGIFGDTVGTWTHEGGTSIFDLLRGLPAVGPKVDLFAFGYTSNMFAAGSLSIQEAANSLHGRLQLEQVLDYPAVVFVAHSMGGLVVLRELLTHREDLLPRVRGLVFYATPQEGSQITRIAGHVANNPAIAEMLPGDQNLSLQQLDNEWKALPARPPVRCAYEKRPTRGVMVVQVMSATRFCDGTPVAIDADHLQIVKPDRPGHDAMMVLVNALNEFALGSAVRAVLDTPDFVPEQDHAVFTMTDPFGRSVARLNNTGGSALRYTIGPPSDGRLFVWPDDTPRTLPAGGRELLRFGLGFGATATEYRVTLTSDVSGSQVVVVRVPDLAALMAQQVRLAADVSRDLGALLSSPATSATFAAAAADDAAVPEAVTRAIRDSVARRTGELPESATWVVAADLMDAANWPGLAIRALRHAEQASPATALAPAVQQLAGTVAARSGQTRIFASAPTAVPTGPVPERLQPFADAGAAGPAADVARLMQNVPALKSQGLSLQGDLQRARGDVTGARRTFTEAAAIRPSPSISSRLSIVTVPATPGPSGAASRARIPPGAVVVAPKKQP